MKAVLVLDEMPKSCSKCKFQKGSTFFWCELTYCLVSGLRESGRGNGCPLRPMPKRKIQCRFDTRSVGYTQGWNDCLRTIERGKK